MITQIRCCLGVGREMAAVGARLDALQRQLPADRVSAQQRPRDRGRQRREDGQRGVGGVRHRSKCYQIQVFIVAEET